MNGRRREGSIRSFLMALFFIAIPVGVGFYYLHNKQIDLIKYLELVISQKEKFETAKKTEDLPTVLSSEAKTTTWLDVQKKVKDTVIQIFTQVSGFNWIEPYKTPDQFEGSGSGFFINDEGYFVTNFHVVNQASSVQIQMPSFGREKFDVEIVGVCPDRDIALLKLTDESFDKITDELGKISYLNLGNSDSVVRTQEILALGYPLGQERLKSTLGIVSGRERAGFIQITAALNPGNSGGPSINSSGEVIGVNFAIIREAQSVGYIIPINEIKSTLKDLLKVKLLRKPILGCIFTIATPEMVKYLGNPAGGGWYIARVFENTILENVGVKEDDMLYEVNGHKLDLYGELSVPWSEDKISLLDFLNRFTVGDDIHFVIYRRGARKDFQFKLNNKYLPPIRKVYPEFEHKEVDYEVLGGMVVMPLTLNHAAILVERVTDLAKYIKPELQHDPAIIITNVLPDSQARKTRVLTIGSVIDEVNGHKVETLDDFRNEVRKCKKGGFLTIKTSDKMFAALLVDSILKDEDRLASRYFYKKSNLLDEIS